MAEMIKENSTRKIDHLGRLSIPKGLRNRFEIEEGAEIEFFTMDDYICLRKMGKENRYARLAREMRELGLEVPEELLVKLEDGD